MARLVRGHGVRLHVGVGTCLRRRVAVFEGALTADGAAHLSAQPTVNCLGLLILVGARLGLTFTNTGTKALNLFR